jgi:hypothetical protein
MKTNLLLALVVFTMMFISAGNVFAAKGNYDYVIKYGDRLWTLCEKHYGPGGGNEYFMEVAAASDIPEPDFILPGDHVKFVPAHKHVYKHVAKKTAGKKHVAIQKKTQKTVLAKAIKFDNIIANETHVTNVGIQAVEKVSIPAKTEEKADTAAISDSKDFVVPDQLKPKGESSAVITSNKVTVPEAPTITDTSQKKEQDAQMAPNVPEETVKTDMVAVEALEKSSEEKLSNINPFLNNGASSTSSSTMADIVKIDGEIGYVWGCLDMFGKCQTFGGSLDVYKNSEGVNKFGLDLGAELSVTNMTDVDSNTKRLRYAYFAGLAYKYEPNEKMRLVVKNGLMYQKTEDDISGIGGIDLSSLGVDLSQMGIDQTRLNVNFKRGQSGWLFYNKTDYTQKFEAWRMHLGTELRLPLSMEFSTDLPVNSMGSKKLDQSLAFLRFGVQRKINDNLFVGVETIPVFYSGETNLFGAMAGLSLDWKMIALKGGVLMHPYGLTKQATDNGGSFSEMLNAFLSFSIKF